MKRIDKDSVMQIMKLVIGATGGTYGIRDYGLLDLSLCSPFQTFEGVELYSTIEEKGAKTCYNLISNHAFTDGNKRIGLLVMLTLFRLNGVALSYTDEDLVLLGLSLARGDMGYNELLCWVKTHKRID